MLHPDVSSSFAASTLATKAQGGAHLRAPSPPEGDSSRRAATTWERRRRKGRQAVEPLAVPTATATERAGAEVAGATDPLPPNPIHDLPPPHQNKGCELSSSVLSNPRHCFRYLRALRGADTAPQRTAAATTAAAFPPPPAQPSPVQSPPAVTTYRRSSPTLPPRLRPVPLGSASCPVETEKKSINIKEFPRNTHSNVRSNRNDVLDNP